MASGDKLETVAAIQPPFMEKKTRRLYSPEEKVRILRLQLLGNRHAKRL
jgi:hypothetical protein